MPKEITEKIKKKYILSSLDIKPLPIYLFTYCEFRTSRKQQKQDIFHVLEYTTFLSVSSIIG